MKLVITKNTKNVQTILPLIMYTHLIVKKIYIFDALICFTRT